VLVALHPDKAGVLKAALASYLAVIPDSDGKLDGIKVGEAAAAKSWRQVSTTAPTRPIPN